MLCIIYHCIQAHSHSTVHYTGRFYCLIPAVCSLHHRCRSLQSSRLYWRDCVDHLWECQDHCSKWLEYNNKCMSLHLTCNREWCPFSNMSLEEIVSIDTINALPKLRQCPHSNLLYVRQDADVDCYI